MPVNKLTSSLCFHIAGQRTPKRPVLATSIMTTLSTGGANTISAKERSREPLMMEGGTPTSKRGVAAPIPLHSGHRTRFHSGLFEQRDRSSSTDASAIAENEQSDSLGIRLMPPSGEGVQCEEGQSLRGPGRGRFALYALLSILGAVALSLTIYFVSRPKMPSVPGSPFARSCTIFCNGQVLTAVQSSHLYNDSKTFVDQPLITDPEEVLAAFEATFGGRDTPPTRQELSSFVSSFFLTAGSDTEPYVPTDYTPLPPQLAKISNSTLMDFALGLNDLWLQLGRRIVDDVRRYPQRYSLIWQPYPLVVPGGRFLESYYWDSVS